jgi:hypothetical protein
LSRAYKGSFPLCRPEAKRRTCHALPRRMANNRHPFPSVVLEAVHGRRT